MLYSTIEIKPTIDDEWQVLNYDMPHERAKGNPKPSAMGFYHYHRNIGAEKAFEELKAEMLKKHEEEIARLMASRDSLIALENPYKGK